MDRSKSCENNLSGGKAAQRFLFPTTLLGSRSWAGRPLALILQGKPCKKPKALYFGSPDLGRHLRGYLLCALGKRTRRLMDHSGSAQPRTDSNPTNCR